MLKEKLKMMNGVLENGNYQLGQFQFAVLVPAGFGAGTPQQDHIKTRKSCRCEVPVEHKIFKN